ncbi:MAG: hypothetical protein NTY45_08870 [Elusimicrobia bacterium]|nr:hypothetical protein [Elusimicrobiota bacterium]
MDKLKKFTRAVFLAAQRALVPACLFIAYVFAVGAMAALDRIFHFQPRKRPGKSSYWQPAQSAFTPDGGGKDGPEDALSQS